MTNGGLAVKSSVQSEQGGLLKTCYGVNLRSEDSLKTSDCKQIK